MSEHTLVTSDGQVVAKVESGQATAPVRSQVTSLAEIRNKACQVVALPGWEPGETFNAKLRRASLLSLVQSGSIPNQLLPIVYKIINGEGQYNPLTDSNPEEFTQFIEMLNAVCKAVLVEPTYDEVSEYLTDIQRSAIFIYAQQGLRSLERFRQRQDAIVEAGGGGEGVRSKAE
jgi:hypothetical protein